MHVDARGKAESVTINGFTFTVSTGITYRTSLIGINISKNSPCIHTGQHNNGSELLIAVCISKLCWLFHGHECVVQSSSTSWQTTQSSKINHYCSSVHQFWPSWKTNDLWNKVVPKNGDAFMHNCCNCRLSNGILSCQSGVASSLN